MQAHDEESLFDQLSQLADATDATEASSTNARDGSNSIAITDLVGLAEDPANPTPTEQTMQDDSQMQTFLHLPAELDIRRAGRAATVTDAKRHGRRGYVATASRIEFQQSDSALFQRHL
eukprot:1250738-Prymnesium_polylepis.3